MQIFAIWKTKNILCDISDYLSSLTASVNKLSRTVRCALIRELSCWVSQLRQRTLYSGSQQSETARWKKRRGIHVWLVDNNSLWYSHSQFFSLSKKILVLDQCLWVKRLDQNKLIYFKNEFHGKKKKISCWKALLKNNIFCDSVYWEARGLSVLWRKNK